MYPRAHETFTELMNAMKANYGTEHFNPTKCAMIWEELKEFSPKQIRSICTFVLRDNQFAPKLSAFADFAAMLREKIRQAEREEHRREAKDFWEGTFHSTEVKQIVNTINQRLQNKIPEQDYRQFQEMLLKAGKKSA